VLQRRIILRYSCHIVNSTWRGSTHDGCPKCCQSPTVALARDWRKKTDDCMISPKGDSEADQPAEIRCTRTSCAKWNRRRIFVADRGELCRQHIGWPSAPRGSPIACRRRRLQAVPARARGTEAQLWRAIYALLPLLPPARAARRAADQDSGVVRLGEWDVQVRVGQDDPDANKEEGREDSPIDSRDDCGSGDHGFVCPSEWWYSTARHADAEARRKLLVVTNPDPLSLAH